MSRQLKVSVARAEESSTAQELAAFLRANRQTRLLSLVVRHGDGGAIAGFLALDDADVLYNQQGSSEQLAAWALSEATELGYKQCTTAYISRVVVAQEVEVSATNALLRSAFSHLPSLRTLLLATNEELGLSQAALAANCSLASQNRPLGAWLYECPRNAVLPLLNVRKAREEDHDDLLPLLAAGQARHPSLAALPESCRPDEPYALTRLITSQDSHTIVLVGEAHGKLIGFMVATSDVDVAMLQQSFELSCYDGFLSAELYEGHEAAARSLAARKKQQMGAGSGEDSTAPSEDEVRKLLLPMLAQSLEDDQDQHTLFAITMLCLHERYEHQASEFLPAAFDAFPGKEYCVLSLPHSMAEPALASCMSRVPALPGSLFPEVLLLLQQASLLLDWEVRVATADDVVGVHSLIASMPEAEALQEAFLLALGRGNALIALCEGEAVGVCSLAPQVDILLLRANFELDAHLPPNSYPADAHAEIELFVMNPIFERRAGAFLAGVLREAGKGCLHYALLPGQPAPDLLPFTAQVPPRHRAPPRDQQAQFALFTFTKGLAYVRRSPVNARIVVAGASEAGLACLERLLLHPSHAFTSLTLLAPGGISVGGVACTYSAGIIARLALEASVTVLDAHLTALDREERVLELEGGSCMAYDALVLAAGMQDQLAAQVMDSCPEAGRFVVQAQQLVSDFREADVAGLSCVLVHGNSLQAYTVIHALQSKGLPADCIKLVTPSTADDAAGPLLRSLAQQADISLPAAQHSTLQAITPSADDSRAMCTLAEPDGSTESIEADMVVGCSRAAVSPALFGAVDGASLVWDGRLVVDAGFRTNDAAIYGVGPVAKFSRRYTSPEVHMEHYNSRELGICLADSLVASLQNSSTPTPTQLPQLRTARVLGCTVPTGSSQQGWSFAFAGCPAAIASPSAQPPAGGWVLSSSSERGSMQLLLDGRDNVHSVAYLGPTPPQASKLSALIGLPFSFLQKGMKAAAADKASVATSTDIASVASTGAKDAEQSVDLLEALNGPWAELLYHDAFGQLRSTLLAKCAGRPLAEAKFEAQQAVLELLEAHAGELAAYKQVPAAVAAY